MSFEALAWAATVRVESTAQRAVLVTLADHHNKGTGRCDPGLALIGERAVLSSRQVERILHQLERIQLITSRKGQGRNHANAYELHLGAVGTPDTDVGCTASHTRHPARSHPTSASSHPTSSALTPDICELTPDTGVGETYEPVTTNQENQKNTRALARLDDESTAVDPLPSAAERLPRVEVEPERFRDFWSAYPRKIARNAALRSYAKALRRDGLDLIASGLRAWRAYWLADQTEERFIPHPTTWLNQSRYLDAPPAPSSNGSRPLSIAERSAERVRRRVRGER